jgi:hypothetical protein
VKRSGGHRGDQRRGINLVELRPKPCVHERRGGRHSSNREWVDCLEKNGVPGFSAQEVFPDAR